MNSPNSQIILRFVVGALALALFCQETAYCQESKDIFAWVARQLNIADAGPPPDVHYVDKSGLQVAFTRSNRHSYRQWEAQYGAHQAEKFMNFYLQELVGMFDPHSESIYVGSFLSPCRQEAILAHEFTHYFQQRQYGRIQPKVPGAQNLQLKREMEASALEKRYGESFCNDQ